MINITLDQYLERIAWHSEAMRNQGPWFHEVVAPWISDVAPVKTVEYGIDCWQRLGSRGLVVDINACYYRWNTLRMREQNGDSLTNALVDLYGYSAMYCVCLGAERNMAAMSVRPVNMFVNNEAWQLNEWLIEHIWDQSHPNIRVLGASRHVATALAKQAWEEYH